MPATKVTDGALAVADSSARAKTPRAFRASGFECCVWICIGHAQPGCFHRIKEKRGLDITGFSTGSD